MPNERAIQHLGAIDIWQTPRLAIPDNVKKLELWVRTFDTAANASEVRAISMNLRRPRPR